MFNSIDFYRALGAKVADRDNNYDTDGAEIHVKHFARALELEENADKVTAGIAYFEGYNGERRIPCSNL